MPLPPCRCPPQQSARRPQAGTHPLAGCKPRVHAAAASIRALTQTHTTLVSSVVQGHGALMAAAAARLVSLLNDAADGGAEVDVWRSVGQLTMDVVGACCGCCAVGAVL